MFVNREQRRHRHFRNFDPERRAVPLDRHGRARQPFEFEPQRFIAVRGLGPVEVERVSLSQIAGDAGRGLAAGAHGDGSPRSGR